ncbi:MAG: amino acid adenylation domain-containing protein [Rickettsiales bacterium]|nr:amino acid adenylation domain-containing protein [Rickettsiales bacterium]
MTTTIYNMGLRFKSIARDFPHHIALSFADGTSLAYGTLDTRSDEVAAHLLKAGAVPQRVVVIVADKHPITYTAMLACLKIGAPYVVLDTASPMARLDKILSQCQPAIIVSEKAEFSWGDTRAVLFDDLKQETSPIDIGVIEAVSGSTPAYVMFTSGSTGFPKGVTISHASMLNFCHWARETFTITPEDCLSGVNPLYFDNSVFDVTASLFNGACLRPVARDVLAQAKQLVEHTSACTMWFSVPSLLIYLGAMKALDKSRWPSMRAIIFGGEGFAKAELKKLHSMFGMQATLWNVYGPTECTCICSAYAISDDDFADMNKLAPLGLLAPIVEGSVMNDDGTKQVEGGEVGELYLYGPQIALGYYNDPERTRASFGEQPPCYRTGDLVYRDTETGYYHFAGRKDNQIKHMGYRIELEEIEAALNGFAEVAQAAVIYDKHATHGGRIIAFMTCAEDIEPAVLKTRLRELLPSYMIPEELHVMPALPKNANGKIDRGALKETVRESHA